MTSEAPERIWLWRDEPHGNLVVSTPSELYPRGSPQYIRVDLHQQDLDAAREEGRRAGLEEAAKAVEILKGQCVDRHVKIWAENRAEAIRALIDKPGDAQKQGE